jgi:hypothetical protein
MRGYEAMTDFLVGLAVMIFIALVATYLYAPDVFAHWLRLYVLTR